MSFNVEENAVFIHDFSKNLPTVGGGHPPLKNPGYAIGHGHLYKVNQLINSNGILLHYTQR